MKKEITIPFVLMSFLIGCSFSKSNEKNLTATNVSQPKTLNEKVRFLSIDSLRAELKNESATKLNKLDENGNTLFDIAMERGSIDVIRELIAAGYSPFLPNNLGISLYNRTPNDPFLTNVLYNQENISSLRAIQLRGNWKALSNAVNTYEISCDSALHALFSMLADEPPITLSRFLNETKNCKHSVQNEKAQKFFQDIVNKYLRSNLKDFSDVLSLMRNIPKDSQYIKIYSGGEYHVHPIILLNLLQELGPAKAQFAISEMEKILTPNDEVLRFVWTDNSKNQLSRVLAYFGDNLNESILNDLKKEVLFNYEDILHKEEE